MSINGATMEGQFIQTSTIFCVCTHQSVITQCAAPQNYKLALPQRGLSDYNRKCYIHDGQLNSEYQAEH